MTSPENRKPISGRDSNDIGKSTIAVCVIDQQEKMLLELTIPNTTVGMKTLAERLQKLPGFSLETTLFCLEYTGVYCQPMVSFFYARSTDIWLDSAVRIKNSLGIKRGKTDKADVRTIARYSIHNQSDKQLFTLSDDLLQRVCQLAQQCERLMKMAKELTDLSEDYTSMGLSDALKLHHQSSNVVLCKYTCSYFTARAAPRSPQSLDKDIINSPPLAIHTNLYFSPF